MKLVELPPKDQIRLLKDLFGVLVPGGFGYRGIEGKIAAIRFARESKIPYLGLCLGMQCAVIEFARNACAAFVPFHVSHSVNSRSVWST